MWIDESQRAEDPDAPAPFSGEMTAEELRSVANNLRKTLKRMAA